MVACASSLLFAVVLYVFPICGQLFMERNATITNGTGDYYIASLHDFGSGTDYFKYDTLTCSNGPDCFITCDADSACYSGTLYASENVDNIYLICPNEQSCSYLDIYPSDNLKSIEMYCPNYFSCSHINIHSSPSDSFIMECTDDRACVGADYDLSHTTNINITCSYVTSSTSTTYSPCSGDFHMEYATNVDIFCAKASCYFAVFFLNYTNSVNIIANDRSAVKYAQIYAQSMPAQGGGLSLECQLAYPCSDTRVYCPVDAQCAIDCPDSSSCYNLYTFIKDGMYDQLSLNCSNSDSCNGMDIMCNNSIGPGSSATSAHYRTIMTYDEERSNEWFCGTWDIYGPYSCCPFPTDPGIDCDTNGYTDANGDCLIDCTSLDCKNRVIDGLNANSLSINCNKAGGSACKGTKVKCPSADGTACDVLCDEAFACKSIVMQVTANALSSITMHCGANESCSETSIVFDTSLNNEMPLTSVSEIHLMCSGYQSCKDNVFFFKAYEIQLIDTFTMNCVGDESCTFNEIDLWLEDGINTLNITCDGRYACGDVQSSILKEFIKITHQFDTNINTLFNLECNGYYSCYQSKIDVLSPGITNIACNADSACLSTSTYSYYFIIGGIANGSIIDISCDSQLSSAATNTTSACTQRRFTLNYEETARNTQNVNILCNSWDCFEAEFELNWAKDVSVDCQASYACKKAIITAPNVEQLSINCDNNDNSCAGAMIECPAFNVNGCDISCDSTGSNVCDDMQISVNDGYVYNSYLNLDCGTGSGSCDGITFECLNLDYAMVPKSTVNYVWNSAINAYECDSSTLADCCPSYDNTQIQEITCASSIGQLCSIDCSATAEGDCNNAVIDGSLASELVLNCNAANDCSNSSVICAVGGCTVNCNAEAACRNLRINYFGNYMDGDIATVALNCNYADACSYTYINAQKAHTVLLECTGNCEYAFISSQYAKNIDISCVGADSYIDLFQGCNNHVIYGQYAEQFFLDCAKNHGCYYNKYYVDEADLVTVKGRGQYAVRSIYLYASDASSVDIYCAGKERYVCDGYWRYNELVTSIFCYGYGCDNMGTHYIHQNFSALDLYWNGCDTCDSLGYGYASNYCFGTSSSAKWTIDCGTSTDGVWKGTTCSPLNCECLGLSDRMKTEFITDSTDSFCEISASNPWPTPTSQPTANPTATPTASSSHPSASPTTAEPTNVPTAPTTATPSYSPTTAVPTTSPVEVPVVTPSPQQSPTDSESTDDGSTATCLGCIFSFLFTAVISCVVY